MPKARGCDLSHKDNKYKANHNKTNPGKHGKLFDESHPYFPGDCASCPFNSGFKAIISRIFTNRKKDCNKCSRINARIHQVPDAAGYIHKNHYSNGGELLLHELVDKKKGDYQAIVNVAQHFAKDGAPVKVTPAVHRKSPEYEEIYKDLIGTKYENKCPDLKVGKKFYEYESFERPWTKNKVGRMLKHGCVQSPYLVIDNSGGGSDRFLRKRINDMLRTNKIIKEVWVYEKGKTRPFFIEGNFIK